MKTAAMGAQWLYERSPIARFYRYLGQEIAVHPQRFILWPAAIAFVLSYSSVYLLLASPASFHQSWLSDYSSVRPYDVSAGVYAEPEQFVLKQLWIQSSIDPFAYYKDAEFPSVFEPEFLKSALQLQSQILDGVPICPFEQDNKPTEPCVFVHSPFWFWNNSEAELSEDPRPLRTVNTRPTPHSNANIPLAPRSVFAGLSVVNGKIAAAEALLVSIFYPAFASDIAEQLELNLAAAANNSPNSLQIHLNPPPTRRSVTYSFNASPMSLWDHIVLSVAYILMAVYFLVNLASMRSVKSRLGVVAAFLVEMLLAFLSACSVSFYLLRQHSVFNIPLQVLPFVVMVVGMENMLRLVNAVLRAPREQPPAARFSAAYVSSGITSTLFVIADVVILALLYPFGSASTRQFCVFATCALIVEHLLHLTYFAAVFSVDLRRTELSDLLDEAGMDSSGRGFGPSLDGRLFSAVARRRGLYELLRAVARTRLASLAGSLVVLLFLAVLNLRVLYFRPAAGSIPSLGSPGTQIRSDMLTAGSAETSDGTSGLHMPFGFFLGDAELGVSLLDISRSLGAPAGRRQERYTLSVLVEEPVFVVPRISGSSVPAAESVPPTLSLPTIYGFDVYYLLELVASLVFVLSVSSLILKYFLVSAQANGESTAGNPGDSEKTTGGANDTLASKTLCGYHKLDIVKIYTASSCPFVVSVGMDHQVLVWSPLAGRGSANLPQPISLPVDGESWPVSQVALEKQGSYIAVLSRNGLVKCWSRKWMTYLWTVSVQQLMGDTPVGVFFRRRSVPKGARGNVRAGSLRGSLRGSIRSGAASPLLTATEFNTNNFNSVLTVHDEDGTMELLVLLRCGILVIVSCADGTVREERLSAGPLVCGELLQTPRVNDRLVATTASGEVVVATAVANRWKTRQLIVRDSYNYVAQFQPTQDFRRSRPGMASVAGYNRLAGGSSALAVSAARAAAKIPSSAPASAPAPAAVLPAPGPSALLTVAYVGMIVRVSSLKAELIDVQTGTLVRTFHIGQFKPGTIKVFHDQPTHCRFCGCASIASLSIAYTEADSDMVILHTYTNDNRAKNNICMRVERDPRETRCLGFETVTEHQHWLSDVSGWEVTGMNMLMGVRKKEAHESREKPAEESSGVGIGGAAVWASGVGRINSEDASMGLRSRRSGTGSGISGFEKQRKTAAGIVWEGWTMNAAGKVSFYEIPWEADSRGLLVKNSGPVAPFGYKAIVVGFGNIMKLLYFGNEDLIDSEEDLDGFGGRESNSSLAFANRRRKTPATVSRDFGRAI